MAFVSPSAFSLHFVKHVGQIAPSCCCHGFISSISGLYCLSVIPVLLNVKKTKGPHSMSTGAAIYSNEMGLISNHPHANVLFKTKLEQSGACVGVELRETRCRMSDLLFDKEVQHMGSI